MGYGSFLRKWGLPVLIMVSFVESKYNDIKSYNQGYDHGQNLMRNIKTLNDFNDLSYDKKEMITNIMKTKINKDTTYKKSNLDLIFNIDDFFLVTEKDTLKLIPEGKGIVDGIKDYHIELVKK